MVKDASQYREVYRTCAEFGRPDGKSTIPAGASRSAVNKIKRVEFPADPLNGHATHDHADRIHSWPQPQWTIQNVATAPQPQAPAQWPAYATQQYWAHHTEAPTAQQPQQHTYYNGSRQWPTASSGTQQQNQATRQSEGQLEYQVRATHLPATSCNVPSASKPIDPKLVEIIADIKLEGVDVSATFDTGSPVTVIRESLWVKVAQNGVQLHPARLRMS